MSYLPFYAGGAALAAVVLLHYALLHAQLGVSGRITTLVNRARARASEQPELSDAEMLEALRAMTASEFGDEAVGEAPAEQAAPVVNASTLSTTSHVLFFVGLVLGGFVATQSVGAFAPTPTLGGELFAHYLGTSMPMGHLVLFAGGILVGFGTRMSGGCTSGHGLIGVPLLEPGSLASTAGFFGSGIAVSLTLEALR